MKNFVIFFSLALVAVSVRAEDSGYHASASVASLGACESRSLLIELNVDDKTPKYQMIEAIKLLADYPSFTITPARSEQSEIAFRATLTDHCVSDSCAKALGWFSLQARLERFKGVAVSCDTHEPVAQPHAPGRAMPMPSPGDAPGGGDPNHPPPPGSGGVTGGN